MPEKKQNQHDGITGTRSKAETNRVLTGTINRVARAQGVEVAPWQMRALLKALNAAGDSNPEAATRALMSAPWYPKQRRRHWRLGEGGGWSTRS